MPFKDIPKHYRTFDGVRWPAFMEIMNDEIAQEIVHAKSLGARIKIRKCSGKKYYHDPIAYMHPDDHKNIGYNHEAKRWYFRK